MQVNLQTVEKTILDIPLNAESVNPKEREKCTTGRVIEIYTKEPESV